MRCYFCCLVPISENGLRGTGARAGAVVASHRAGFHHDLFTWSPQYKQEFRDDKNIDKIKKVRILETQSSESNN